MALIVFIIILSILIVVHEWGHYIAAKKCGVVVEQFALGFGPKLWSCVWDNTEFCLCLIPLGGYVKMEGDERSKLKGNSREFLSKSVGQKIWIVLMGPLVNLVLAYICFWFVFVIGKVDLEATFKKASAIIGVTLANSPAFKADLKANDEIISIDGRVIKHWADLQDYVSSSKSASLKFIILRNGQQIIKDIIPSDNMQKDMFGKKHIVRMIGASPSNVIVRYGPIEALGQAAVELKDISIKTYGALFEMFTGRRSPKEAMGVIGMFFVIKFALSINFAFLLYIVGLISASLALFNLLPLIPLDGGHILLFGIEKLRGKALSQRTDETISKVGLTLILTLALFIFYVDFERIGLIDHIVRIFRG